MISLKYCVGIDVSMKDFHCCLSIIDSAQEVRVKASHKFSNDKKGFALFAEWIKKHCKEPVCVVFVMEATGVYHEQLAWFLHGKGHTLSILLPTRAKRYLQADGAKSKNDKIDAKGLSRIGAEKKLDFWIPPSAELHNLRSLTRHHQGLTEMRTVYSNQLHSLEHSQFCNKEIVRQLKKGLRLIEKQISEMEQSIAGVIQGDPVLQLHCKNITAIKGIGILSFAVVAAETDGFALFDNAARLVSYAGYDVVENQSGSHSGRTKISKRGNSRIRRILHMPALVARREDQPQFKNLYNRIYEKTGIKMKGCVAVQKKLLVMMYYLWKKQQMYNPDFNYPEKIIAPDKAGTTQDEVQKEISFKL